MTAVEPQLPTFETRTDADAVEFGTTLAAARLLFGGGRFNHTNSSCYYRTK